MGKFTGEVWVETAGSGEVVRAAPSAGKRYALYVGLDVHEDSIAVALAWPRRGESQYLGEIANNPKAVRKLVEQLSALTGGRADTVLL